MEKLQLNNGVEMPLLEYGVFQIELHPFCQQKELWRIMEKCRICPMAWAPFTEGRNGIFQDRILVDIGKKYGKTPAQVVLWWIGQNNILAIPKLVHTERIRQNYDVDDFELSVEDVERIEKMDLRKSLVLDIQSMDEVHRLRGIRFEQSSKIYVAGEKNVQQ